MQILSDLSKLISERKKNMPEGSYVSSLFKQGQDRIIQKVGEEAVELVIAAKNDDKELFVSESADLIFHWLVLLQEKGVTLDEIEKELQKRKK